MSINVGTLAYLVIEETVRGSSELSKFRGVKVGPLKQETEG